MNLRDEVIQSAKRDPSFDLLSEFCFRAKPPKCWRCCLSIKEDAAVVVCNGYRHIFNIPPHLSNSDSAKCPDGHRMIMCEDCLVTGMRAVCFECRSKSKRQAATVLAELREKVLANEAPSDTPRSSDEDICDVYDMDVVDSNYGPLTAAAYPFDTIKRGYGMIANIVFLAHDNNNNSYMEQPLFSKLTTLMAMAHVIPPIGLDIHCRPLWRDPHGRVWRRKDIDNPLQHFDGPLARKIEEWKENRQEKMQTALNRLDATNVKLSDIFC